MARAAPEVSIANVGGRRVGLPVFQHFRDTTLDSGERPARLESAEAVAAVTNLVDRPGGERKRCETMVEPREGADAGVRGILEARRSKPVEGGSSFSLGHRLFRLAWNVTWLLLASWTPAPMHGWRRFVLRLFGAKMGKGCGVYASARVWDPRNLEMGAYAFIGRRVICYSMAKIRFEPYSLASQGAHLCAGSHDISDPDFQTIARPIVIGEHAWIAADAFVGPGVTVGTGAVLGARGVAFSDLPPWTVSVGNPSRVLKTRAFRGEPTRAGR